MMSNFNIQDAFRGKTIKIVAPASGVSTEKLKVLQTLCANSLSALSVEIPEDMLFQEDAPDKIPYHANADEMRFEQLKIALLDESENTIIWALRGGYGSARLLDKLRELPKPKTPKIFIGFSDNTALHLFLSQQWGWKTIHGSGFSQLLDAKQNPENFLKIAELLNNVDQTIPFTDLQPMNNAAIDFNIQNCGNISFTGGNLTLIENSIGTHWQIQTAGKVILLEEVGEKGYRIDRSLYHLYQAGIFQHVKAIILGQFSNSENNDDTIDMALQRFSKDIEQNYHIPVYKTNQFGHGNVNYPWRYG